MRPQQGKCFFIRDGFPTPRQRRTRGGHIGGSTFSAYGFELFPAASTLVSSSERHASVPYKVIAERLLPAVKADCRTCGGCIGCDVEERLTVIRNMVSPEFKYWFDTRSFPAKHQCKMKRIGRVFRNSRTSSVDFWRRTSWYTRL